MGLLCDTGRHRNTSYPVVKGARAIPPQTTPKRFNVIGSGDFPFDMLRYDSCYPARGEDVLDMTKRDDLRMVTLETKAEHSPTIDRWRSFGWNARAH